MLDARDADDDTHADRTGDLITEICRVAERFNRAPELLGTFTVLLIENIDPDAPLFGGDLGLDSIDALELALAISKRYGFQLR